MNNGPQLTQEQREKAEALLPSLKNLRDLYANSYLAMSDNYPQGAGREPRIWAFNKGAMVMNSIFLSYSFSRYCMNEPWLTKYTQDPFQVDYLDPVTANLHDFIRIGWA